MGVYRMEDSMQKTQTARSFRWFVAALMVFLCVSFLGWGCERGGNGNEPSNTNDGGVVDQPDGSVATEIDPSRLPAGLPPNPLPQAPCAPSLEDFRTKIWEPILAQKCLNCHYKGGLARSSRFLLALPAESDFLSFNHVITASMANEKVKGISTLLSKPTGLHASGHTGGVAIPVGSEAYAALADYIARATGETKDCKQLPPDPPVSCDEPTPKVGLRKLRRLSRTEFDRSVADLFGFASTWGADMVVDTVVHHFSNNADALTVHTLLADQIHKAAEAIAAKAILSLDKLVPCNPAQGDRACAKAFLESFGGRAFRMVLPTELVERYLALFDLGAKKTFARGIEWMLSAMLQSPMFWYRQEMGSLGQDGLYKLSSAEIAASLSYLLHGTTPDATLLQAVQSGKLQTTAEIEAQAKRLLQSERYIGVVEQFVIEWLSLDRVLTVPKDAVRYPNLTPAIRRAMLEEARRFIRAVMRDGKASFSELLTANYSILNKELAAFYGVKAPETVDADGFGKVVFSDGVRGGLLSLGALLVVHGLPNTASPIHTGVMVRERLLCEHLDPPPASLMVVPPGLDLSKTTRERYKEHSDNPDCRGCHEKIDPIGFGFSHFDGVGVYQLTENGKPIDARGEVIGPSRKDATFDGVRQLSILLAQDNAAQRCFVRQWMRFAYGVDEKGHLACLVDGLHRTWVAQELSIPALLLALTQTPHFTQRRSALVAPKPSEEPVVSETSAPDAGAEAMPEPPPPTMLEVKSEIPSDWGAGYCRHIDVTNKDSVDQTWKIRLTVDGTITQLWNATSTDVNAQEKDFEGVEWNRTLKPAQTIQFGFCATR